MLFKGGTSLSKAFGLITRFSEDIDITIFRSDLGFAVDVPDLNLLSGKQRRVRLDAIRAACQTYISASIAVQFRALAAARLKSRFRLEPDPADKDCQTLLFWYPVVAPSAGDYVRAVVKIEFGAKSALDPHVATIIRPYIAEELPALNLNVPNILTVNPERTFWDKVIILHGLRQWHDRRGELRHGGQRVSRHYYDVHQLMHAANAGTWLADRVLAINCAQHARLFFGSADLGLKLATPGTYTLTPDPAMKAVLAKDYAAMSGMVFGEIPKLEAVLNTVEQLEQRINTA